MRAASTPVGKAWPKEKGGTSTIAASPHATAHAIKRNVECTNGDMSGA